jgi:hypothetical protein
MSNKEAIYLALLVINLGGTFSNTYGLCKLLRRKFEIFDCVEIVNNLINSGHVNYVMKDGVEQFYINESGNEAIIQHRSRIIDLLNEKFPQESEFISFL